MALITIRPTRSDIAIANFIAAHANLPTEELAEALTWGADGHVLCAVVAAWWLDARRQGEAKRRMSDHILLTTLVASVLPHLFKAAIDQQRPDRRTVRGHWRGVPFSGKAFDAFPSGHAVHVGALASAASRLPRPQRNAVWLLGGGLVATRILLLAHWTSDVLVGLSIGAVLERWLRRLTGYGRAPDRQTAARSRKAWRHEHAA
jgi:membrane-associated phospholipid phosphatase